MRIVTVFGLSVALAICGMPAGLAVAERSTADINGAIEFNNLGVKAAQAGRFQEGVDYLRKAVSLNPDDGDHKRNLSQMLTDWAMQGHKSGKTAQAIKQLEEATTIAEENGPAWFYLGNIYYLVQSDFKKATYAWKKALKYAPNDKRRAVVDRIARAETDAGVERSFDSMDTAHFTVRTVTPSAKAKAVELGAVLERQYAELSSELGVSPPRLTVIVYPRGKFDRVSGGRDWALGFYDGRIRLSEEDLGTTNQELTLMHELAHAFLHAGFGVALPTWVHEGYAQAKEAERELTPREKKIEDSLNRRTQWIPLKWLDRRFAQPTHDEDILRAYVESRYVVGKLMRRFGAEKFREFLTALSKGQDIEVAFDEAFKPLRWSRADNGSLD